MANVVMLKLLGSVRKDTVFQASVTVQGAAPGSDLTVTLEQKRGAEPLLEVQTQIVAVDASGVALAMFDIKLAGPATAILIASAADPAGTYYRPHAESVEVE
jgi:hypothetical protein